MLGEDAIEKGEAGRVAFQIIGAEQEREHTDVANIFIGQAKLAPDHSQCCREVCRAVIWTRNVTGRSLQRSKGAPANGFRARGDA